MNTHNGIEAARAAEDDANCLKNLDTGEKTALDAFDNSLLTHTTLEPPSVLPHLNRREEEAEAGQVAKASPTTYSFPRSDVD